VVAFLLAVLPSAGVLFVFYLGIKALVEADRRERLAQARIERAQDGAARSAGVPATAGSTAPAASTAPSGVSGPTRGLEPDGGRESAETAG
jgi:hypothetical protein